VKEEGEWGTILVWREKEWPQIQMKKQQNQGGRKGGGWDGKGKGWGSHGATQKKDNNMPHKQREGFGTRKESHMMHGKGEVSVID